MKNRSTAYRRPLIFILAEAFINEQDAREREKFYKSGRGREILKKKLKNTFEYLKKYKSGCILILLFTKLAWF